LKVTVCSIDIYCILTDLLE